jgi:hypothetical protein
VYIINSIYVNPIADDLSYAFLGRQNTLLDAWITEYKTWNGRYSSNVFVLTNPIKYNSMWGYKFSPILLIFLTITSVFVFIKTITDNYFKWNQTFIIALLVTLLYLHLMPIISEGVYWYTGAVTYHWANIFLLFYVSLISLYYQNKILFNNNNFHLFLLILCLVFVTGFNEIVMITMLSFHIILLLIFYKKCLPKKRAILLLFAVSIISALIMYLAPGNTVRGQFFSNNHRFFYSILMATLQTVRFLLKWVLSPPLLILSVFYFFLNKKLSAGINLFKQSFYLTPLFSLIILLYVVFIGSFPAYWATGIMGQLRTMNVSFWLFIFLWFVNLTVWFNYYPFELKPLSHELELFFVTAILCLFLFTKNGNDSLNDLLTGKSKRYNSLMMDRSKSINCPDDTIYFKPIDNPPKTLFVSDITPNDAGHWMNRCYNEYYQTEKKILLKK